MFLILFTCFSPVSSLKPDPLHYNNVFDFKCESYPARSLFYKNFCYLIIEDDNLKCSEVIPIFKEADSNMSDEMLKQLNFLRKNETTHNKNGEELLNSKEKLCVLSTGLHCPTDSELIETKCFYLNKSKRSHQEALIDCRNRGMQMFYPHSDRDIKDVVVLTANQEIDEIWLSASKLVTGPWEMNELHSIFDYARWSDTTLLTSSSKKLLTKLALKNKGSTYLGYMNVVEDGTDTQHSFICTTNASTVPIEVTTTVSTTLQTATKKVRICKKWSAWTVDCRLDLCGKCDVQSRRCLNPYEDWFDLRNCYNIPCLFPCKTCEDGCRKTFIGRQFGCVSKATDKNKLPLRSDIAPLIPYGANARSGTCNSSIARISPGMENH